MHHTQAYWNEVRWISRCGCVVVDYGEYLRLWITFASYCSGLHSVEKNKVGPYWHSADWAIRCRQDLSVLPVALFGRQRNIQFDRSERWSIFIQTGLWRLYNFWLYVAASHVPTYLHVYAHLFAILVIITLFSFFYWIYELCNVEFLYIFIEHIEYSFKCIKRQSRV